MSTAYTWKRAEGKGAYRLTHADGDKPKGTLTLQNWYGSEAVVAMQQGGWRFTRRGWWKQNVEVLEGGTVKGVFRPNWLCNGVLKLENRTYRWKLRNVWGTRWDWLDENGIAVLSFRMSSGFRTSATVEGTFMSRM